MGTQFKDETTIQVLDFRSLFPNLVSTTASKGLQGCTSLKKVTFPYKFETIAEQLFNTANLLVIVGDEVNGSSLSSIGWGSFVSSQNLVCYATTPPNGNAPNVKAFYVPDDSVQAYKTKFSNISGRIKPLSEWSGDR